MSVDYIPYSRQSITDEDVDAVCRVLRSDFLTQGPVLSAFESEFARRHGAAHGIGVANATAGLHIACLALGIGPGSRVWTSPNSFLASANCALFCGGQIDFVDIDPATRNMSVDALRQKLHAAQRAGTVPHVVIPVDFAGLSCDVKEMRELADAYGFKILEDASHATGASYLDEPVGAFADVVVFSFHAVKIVTTAEGGMVVTRDAELAHKLRLLRSHGMTRDPADMVRAADGPWYYEQRLLGFNYRLTDLQAALGSSQLERMEQLHASRERLAARYDQLLEGLPLLLPARKPDRRSSWHLYVIEVDERATTKTRAATFQHLRNKGIGVNVHYIPIHTQPYYEALGFRRGDFPASERYYARAITLPLFPALSDEQQLFVVGVVREALE
jgi:UDP-4-amino-4,6-dideoxy-N-acetyl-beta-L-altrosamine transaminase